MENRNWLERTGIGTAALGGGMWGVGAFTSSALLLSLGVNTAILGGALWLGGKVTKKLINGSRKELASIL